MNLAANYGGSSFMQTYAFGSRDSGFLLIQPVGNHELSGIEKEAALLRELAGDDFLLIAVKIPNWNQDLAPWPAPPAFGNESFGNGAAETFREILPLVCGKAKHRIIGGYSLAGLFSLWAGYQTDVFTGIAAASPSVWYPGFTDYMEQHTIRARSVYLSLGNGESRTRNPVMSRVADCIRETHTLLNRQTTACFLEWNEGNHFKDPDLRTAKAFAWVINHSRQSG